MWNPGEIGACEAGCPSVAPVNEDCYSFGLYSITDSFVSFLQHEPSRQAVDSDEDPWEKVFSCEMVGCLRQREVLGERQLMKRSDASVSPSDTLSSSLTLTAHNTFSTVQYRSARLIC